MKGRSTTQSSPQNRPVDLSYPLTSSLPPNANRIRLSSSRPQASWSSPCRTATPTSSWRPPKPCLSHQYQVLMENLRSVQLGKPSILALERRLNVFLRLHPSDENILYTILNTTASRAKARSKMTPRQAYISKWDVGSWEVTKSRKVSEKGATCFDMR